MKSVTQGLVIGFDLDGVLADYRGSLERELTRLSGVKVKIDFPFQEFTIANKKVKHALEVIDYNTVFENCEPMEDIEVIEACFEKITKALAHIMIVTARPERYAKTTEKWLNKHIPGYNFKYGVNLFMGVRSKDCECNGLDIAYFLDDRYSCVKSITNNYTIAYLLLNEGNQKYKRKIATAKSIKDYTEKVFKNARS